MPAAGIASAATHAAARAMRTPRMPLSLAPAAGRRWGSTDTRCAIHTGTIDATITNRATTFTIGNSRGAPKFVNIQIGSVCAPRR